jgi:hypothetical protein
MIYEIQGEMSEAEEQRLNELLFHARKEQIAGKYPRSRYVAVVDGEVVVDSDQLSELQTAVVEMGHDLERAFIGQVGDNKEYMIIL